MIPACAICARESKSWGSLIKHTSQTHKISAEDYYTSYLGTKTSCIHCGSNSTRFLSASEGYSDNCPACKSVQLKFAAVKRRQDLKKNTVAYSQFISRLSTSVSGVWANRSKDEKAHVLRNFRNYQKPGIGKIVSHEDVEIKLEATYKSISKALKLDVDFSKPITPQLDVIVNNNLYELFGF